jgi:putative ABC transport system permease protein
VRALPGVRAAGAIQHLPFSGYSWVTPLDVEGQELPAGSAPPSVQMRVVTPGYFTAIGQPLLLGRPIERGDATRDDVVVVNEVLASKSFGSPRAALGRKIRSRGSRGPLPWTTIVGVVGNVRHTTLTDAPGPEIYQSAQKNSIPAMMLAVRTDGDPHALAPVVRDGIWSVDRDVPLSAIETMEAKIGQSLARPRLLRTVLGAFALLGGLLAIVGVYGVVAYSVTERRRELGIRVALGAARGRIIRTVLREALIFGVVGLAIGIPAAIAGSRLMQSLVFGVSATDPATYAAIALATLATVVAASLLPALRAARVDPVSALKGN